jgi:hypothetical protein
VPSSDKGRISTVQVCRLQGIGDGTFLVAKRVGLCGLPIL